MAFGDLPKDVKEKIRNIGFEHDALEGPIKRLHNTSDKVELVAFRLEVISRVEAIQKHLSELGSLLEGLPNE